MESRYNYLHDLFRLQAFPASAVVDEAMLQSFMNSNGALEGSASFYWLVNYLKQEPVFISNGVKQVLGFHKAFLNSGGMSDFVRLIPAEDRLLLKKVYLDIYEYFQQIASHEKGLYRFDFNYRIQRADQRVISVLQQLMFIQHTNEGNPLVELSVFTDFSTYKSNNTIQLQIFKLQQAQYKRVAACQYDDCLDKLTEREREVIALISRGLIDKEIAEKMCISLHTVKTHRKHILYKTNSRNTAEAVNKYLAK